MIREIHVTNLRNLLIEYNSKHNNHILDFFIDETFIAFFSIIEDIIKSTKENLTESQYEKYKKTVHKNIKENVRRCLKYLEDTFEI